MGCGCRDKRFKNLTFVRGEARRLASITQSSVYIYKVGDKYKTTFDENIGNFVEKITFEANE